MFFVYVLQSLKDQGYYIGCTSDLEKRLLEHNSGITPSIKNRIPFQIIYAEKFLSRKDAFKREKQIKRYKGGEAFKRLIMKI